jgi:hypothetical protein
MRSVLSGATFWQVKRKHRVAAARAAAKVIDPDRNWRRRRSHSPGNMLVFFNAASLQSVAISRFLRPRTKRTRSVKRARQALNDQSADMFNERRSIEQCVSRHIALRGASEAERERLSAQYDAEDATLMRMTQKLLAA